MEQDQLLFATDQYDREQHNSNEPVVCLGMTFANDEERRAYFREELRKKLPELKSIEGFPIGEDDDIINLSDPPYYTACPNPWLNSIVAEWESEKIKLAEEGVRKVDFIVDAPYTEGIKVGKNSAIYNAHTYHTKVPYQIIMRYILHYSQPGDIILDGFAGTGMTGVAATSCGLPDEETKLSITRDFSEAGYGLPSWGSRHAVCGDLSPLCFHISSNYNSRANVTKLKKAIEEILTTLERKFGYFYKIENEYSQIGHINYFVWSEVVACNNCGAEMNVHDLSYDYENKVLHDKLICPSCGMYQKRIEAHSIYNTNYDTTINEVKKELRYDECLINYSARGRCFTRSIPHVDFPQFEGFIPNDKFPSGDKFGDPLRVGCNSVSQVYPERTKYVLAFLYKLINEEYHHAKKELMFIFTSMLPKLTKMNRYMPQHGSRALVGPMANTLYIPPQYVENNPIDQFEYQANKVLKAFEQCSNGTAVQVCSATNSSLPDNSVDYIFTDPPFGANIMYSELNTIAESWLKVKTNNKEEAISNNTQRKGIPEYQAIMTTCLKEYYRVLKPGRWMTVEFSNTSAAFWNCLQHAIQSAGFIISSVTDLNKERGGLHAMLGPTAVKQDLAISCYKPTDALINKLEVSENTSANVWDFVQDLLEHLPVHLQREHTTTAVVERSPKILYDRMIAYYVQHNYPVPMNAAEFQKGLRDHFVERDGMYFTATQVVEYEDKKSKTSDFQAPSLFVSSEADGITWIKNELKDHEQTYSELQPKWMQAMVAGKKGDQIPELMQILEENFIKNEAGVWHNPDPENEADLERVRTRKLLHEFAIYVETAQKPKAKIKEARLEALRCGFKQCYKDKDFATIMAVSSKLPESLLTEDEVLLQYYDIASMRV